MILIVELALIAFVGYTAAAPVQAEKPGLLAADPDVLSLLFHGARSTSSSVDDLKPVLRGTERAGGIDLRQFGGAGQSGIASFEKHSRSKSRNTLASDALADILSLLRRDIPASTSGESLRRNLDSGDNKPTDIQSLSHAFKFLRRISPPPPGNTLNKLNNANSLGWPRAMSPRDDGENSSTDSEDDGSDSSSGGSDSDDSSAPADNSDHADNSGGADSSDHADGSDYADSSTHTNNSDSADSSARSDNADGSGSDSDFRSPPAPRADVKDQSRGAPGSGATNLLDFPMLQQFGGFRKHPTRGTTLEQFPGPSVIRDHRPDLDPRDNYEMVSPGRRDSLVSPNSVGLGAEAGAGAPDLNDPQFSILKGFGFTRALDARDDTLPAIGASSLDAVNLLRRMIQAGNFPTGSTGARAYNPNNLNSGHFSGWKRAQSPNKPRDGNESNGADFGEDSGDSDDGSNTDTADHSDNTDKSDTADNSGNANNGRSETGFSSAAGRGLDAGSPGSGAFDLGGFHLPHGGRPRDFGLNPRDDDESDEGDGGDDGDDQTEDSGDQNEDGTSDSGNSSLVQAAATLASGGVLSIGTPGGGAFHVAGLDLGRLGSFGKK